MINIEKALENAKKEWDNIFTDDYERKDIKYDDWLKIFDKEIKQCNTPIIDLGCGRRK